MGSPGCEPITVHVKGNPYNVNSEVRKSSVAELEEAFATLATSIKENIRTIAVVDVLVTDIPIQVTEKKLKDSLLPQVEYTAKVGLFRRPPTNNVLTEIVPSPTESLAELGVRILQTWISGSSRVVVVINNSEVAKILQVGYLLNLFRKADLRSDTFALKLKDDVLVEKTNLLAAIVFDSSDVNSAVQTLIESYPASSAKHWNIFVQQSAYEKFVARFKSQWPALIKRGGDVWNRSVNFTGTETVNYDFIDIESACESRRDHAIHILQFRTVVEALNVVNHAEEITSVILWTEDIPLALEVSRNIKNSMSILINSLHKFDPTVRSYNQELTSDINVPKTSNNEWKNAISAQKKWDALDRETRFLALRKSFGDSVNVDYSESSQLISSTKLKQFVIVQQQAVGVVSISGVESESEFLQAAFETLLAGNSLLVKVDSEKTQLKMQDVSKLLPPHLVQILFDNLIEPSENEKFSVGVRVDGVIVGRHIRLEAGIPISTLQKAIIQNKIVWMPAGDSISFAK